MVNEFEQGRHLIEEARRQASEVRYPGLQLRALGYLGSFHTVEGRVLESWEVNQKGLEVFWNGDFLSDRGYQFYADLEFGAEQASHWHLALALETEAIAQLEGTARADFQGIAYCRRARLETMLNETDRAKSDLEQSEVLFRKLPEKSARIYKCDCEVSWANSEAQHGTASSALSHLLRVGSIEQYDNFTLRLTYEKAWADLEKARQNTDAERSHLQKIIAIGTKGLAHLKDPVERWEWQRLMEESYRRLLEYTLQHQHSTYQALAEWESFRAMDPSSTTSLTLDRWNKLESLIKTRIAKLQHSTVLAFAVFPSWTQIWIADDRGAKEFRIAIDAQTLKRQVQEFQTLCSDRGSSVEKVNAGGARLYNLLASSIEQYLDVKRTLFIEADQFLNVIPWSALVRRDGSYMGQSYAIVHTPGLLYREPHHSRKGMEPKMLVVSPGAVEYEHVEYLPLPQAEDEADFVVQHYPSSQHLKGLEVTASNVLQSLRKASYFHFTGHARTREYNGELIVHGKDEGDIISASRLRSTSLPRMEMVMLSACQTGGGPDPSRDPNGLVRAFLDAGTRRVIASLWDVDSGSTATLMRSFYVSFRAGQNSEDALRRARTDLIGDGADSHPYYWAAFQVSGPVN